MVHIIHTGDFHLGFPLYREEVNYDYFKPFSFLVEYAIRNNVDLVIIAGDLFDKRDPQSNIQRGFAKEVHKLIKNKIPVFIVTGNHEGSPNPERNIHLDIYNELAIEGVTIAKRIANYTIANLNVIAIPYPFKRNLMHKDEYREKSEEQIAVAMNERILKKLNEIYEQVDKNLPTVFVAHLPILEGHVGGEQYSNFAFDLPISVEELDRSDVSYVSLGHFHERQVMNSKKFAHPFVYCGSIDRLNFGEEHSEKGFYDINIDEKTHKATFQFVQNPYARKFYTINIYKDADIENFDFELVKTSITRVVLYSDISNEELLRKLISEVKKNAFAFAGFEDRRAISANTQRGIFRMTISPKEAIEKYLALRNDEYASKHKDEILQAALRIMNEVENGDKDV
jgi:exonuclease SbcD